MWEDADRQALAILRPLLDAGGYLPWTEGALRPAALTVVCNEIALADRREIVELGSGVSTVVLARLMRERGGRLTSVEHDPHWAAFVRSQLEREGLEGIARLIESPLEPHPRSLDGAPWYSAAAIAGLPERIELLLVDGPPGYADGMARSRYPALLELAARLAPEAVVILDDAEREGEGEILAAWGREPGWAFAVDSTAGIAVGVRPPPR